MIKNKNLQIVNDIINENVGNHWNKKACDPKGEFTINLFLKYEFIKSI